MQIKMPKYIKVCDEIKREVYIAVYDPDAYPEDVPVYYVVDGFAENNLIIDANKGSTIGN